MFVEFFFIKSVCLFSISRRKQSQQSSAIAGHFPQERFLSLLEDGTLMAGVYCTYISIFIRNGANFAHFFRQMC
jgi:hypothetical protein